MLQVSAVLETITPVTIIKKIVYVAPETIAGTEQGDALSSATIAWGKQIIPEQRPLDGS